MKKLILVGALCVLLSGCNLADMLGLNKEVDKALAQVRETQAALVKLSYDVVPGAKWNQLVNDINSGDPELKARAQAFLKNVSQIDYGGQWQGRVAFEHAENTEFEYEIFFAATPHESEAVLWLNDRNYKGRKSRSALQVPASAQRKKELEKALRDTLEQGIGRQRGSINFTADYGNAGAWSDGLFGSIAFGTGAAQTVNERNNFHLNHFAERLSGILLDCCQDQAVLRGPTDAELNFSPATPYLFVVMTQPEWDRADTAHDKFRILATVVDKANAGRSFGGLPVTSIVKTSFEGSIPFKRNGLPATAKYAVANMIGHVAVTPAQLQAVAVLQNSFKEWEEQQAKSRAATKK